MSVLSSLQRLFAGALVANGSAYPLRAQVDYRIEPAELPPAAMYAVLKLFYLSNGCYDDLARSNVTIGRATPAVKAIRNPVPPVVNAWAAKLWPEPLTIVAKRAAIVAPIETVWRWSNWRAKRPMVAGGTGLYGQYWIKVQASQEKGRVWFEYLDPAYVTDFEEDERGFVQMARVDIPKTEEDATGGTKQRTHTEVWSTAEQTYHRWETDGDASGRQLKDLGPPAEEEPFSTFGIDFTPFVRIPFSDIGERHAIGAVQLALEAIAESDLSATNLHAVVYQDLEGVWVVESNGTDPNGRPLPPLRVAAAEPTFDSLGRQTSNGTGSQNDGTITVGKRSIWRLPGGYTMKSTVPDIDYAGSLAILQDHDVVLERLMPALAYSRISEMSGGDLSGRAIRFKLTPFVDQVIGVRSTALEKLAQADAMALTLGQVNGIPGFDAALGTFDAGDFEHTFEDVEVIPIGDFEESQTEAQMAQAFASWRSAGLPDAEALKRAGYGPSDVRRIVRQMAEDAETAVARQQALMSEQDTEQEDDGDG